MFKTLVVLVLTLLLAACAATPIPKPSPGPVVPNGQAEIRDLGPSTETVWNCGSGGGTIVKHPSMTVVTGHAVEWEVGGTTGAGVIIGEGVIPVGVDLSASLQGLYVTKFDQNIQQDITWDLPAEQNTIVEYTLAWREVWQPGYVEVRLADQNILPISVRYRTGIQSDVVGKNKKTCDGQQVSESILPTAVQEQPTIPPSPSSEVDFQPLSLQGIGLAESSNLGLKAGRNVLLGIPFETGWTVTTQSSEKSDLLEVIQLNTNISDSANVYLLIQAGWSTNPGFAERQFGVVTLHFNDGTVLEEPLTIGVNIRDWSQVNSPLTSSNSTEAWRGMGWDGVTPGIMDVLRIPVPASYGQAALTQIQISDSSRLMLSSMDPTIHLLAVTVERLQ